MPISSQQDIDTPRLISMASLVFAAGERPGRGDVAALAERDRGFAISLDPAPEDGRGADAGAAGDWLELLANGLTFDLTGLTPGEPATLPPQGSLVGLDGGIGTARLQAIALQPGPHLTAGAAMLPVVRALAWLAAQLTELPGIRAVAWHPARSWCDPMHFRTSVLRWIDGGPFPGLGLASLAPMPDGGLQSQGLALFTGQELRLEPELTEDRAAGAKIALRLMHWLVEHGKLTDEEQLTAPDGQPLRLEPSSNGRFARAWRG